MANNNNLGSESKQLEHKSITYTPEAHQEYKHQYKGNYNVNTLSEITPEKSQEKYAPAEGHDSNSTIYSQYPLTIT
jgi:hypothetical protein